MKSIKRTFLYISFISSIVIFGQTAFAGVCEITQDVTPCPGKEKKSLKACKGKNPCIKKKKTFSAKSCLKKSLDYCENLSIRIHKSIQVTIKFNGENVSNGQNICNPSRSDYNKCR